MLLNKEVFPSSNRLNIYLVNLKKEGKIILF